MDKKQKHMPPRLRLADLGAAFLWELEDAERLLLSFDIAICDIITFSLRRSSASSFAIAKAISLKWIMA